MLKNYFKLLLLITIFNVISIQPALAKTVYYDTYNHWAANDIDYASNTLKVFQGYGDFTFKPDNNITRAEFITILARTAYSQNQMKEIYTSDMNYKDMSDKHWSYTYVISMYEHLKTNKDYSFTDIFKGQNFSPDIPITREESAALIAAFSKKGIYDNNLIFKDVSTNNKYYKEIRRLYNSGIVMGYEDDTFRGGSFTTRAETASLIRRIFQDMKTSNESNYLNKIEFMPIKGEEMYSYFGSYNLNNATSSDKKYVKAKDTLEYISFEGYIYPEDMHLYDLNAIDTMVSLHEEGYYNVAGTNYYLIVFGKYSDEEKSKLADELLSNAIDRNDLSDSDFMQIFTVVSKYDIKENLYMGALEKWYNSTSNNSAKANILFYRYTYYIKNNNKDMLKSIVFEDLKKSNNVVSLLELSWDIEANAVDFRDYSYGKYSYSIYKDMTFLKYLSGVASMSDKLKVIELPKLLLIEKAEKPVVSGISEFESIYSKYSVNRLYVLNFLGEKERAFVEGINDYDIIKTFNIYKTSKALIDDNYMGILKKVK